ncbi:PREDICTED: 39S ribosomal protein L55, mitochondrial [Thamnophis sirtalis]|uniref:39S ribosomal protein L55, mitochondrial n=1 Tax=Thamnophis sirtalis TaxID=35019 RepID=A0A6I9XB91_9SAUR|nr:PREDICTED: 39S ribosomal protein L55, mitochondrial [Thamnophis sirtalis]
MAAISRSLSILQVESLSRCLLRACGLHTTPSQLNSNRTSIACFPRLKYARLYPVLLVRLDGSTVHLRYKEPRRIIQMPVDFSTLPEAERRSRLRRKSLMKSKKGQEEVATFEDDFQQEYYEKFWNKK